MAKVNRPKCKHPPTATAAATHVNRDPGKASRNVGARYQRELKGADRRCSTVVDTWTGKCWHCEHGQRRNRCKESGGGSICEHGRRRSQCKECGGGSFCEHGRQRHYVLCKECGGGSICEHGRVRSQCKECGGASICEHGRQRRQCKECGGTSICEHGRVRSKT